MNSNVWKIDEAHSSIRFSVRHMVVANIHGRFRRFSAELSFDEANLTRSAVNVTIEAGSIDTGNADRDATLCADNFLASEKFPTLSFRSRRVERAADERLRIVGDLSIRNVTKQVELDVELGGFVADPRGYRRAGFAAVASVSRSDFGMVYNQVLEAGGVAIGDRVELQLEIEAVAAIARVA